MSSIPATMRQVRFNGAGGPEVIGIETVPVPRPGPNQVLVEVVAAGVNRPDCQQRSGKYPPPPGATEVPGLEIAGRIVALGEGVTGLAEGQEVCALTISGGYAEYCVADASLCLPKPGPLSLVEAAGLPENYWTVWTNVFERGRLQKGERFLVHGGSSGIGSTAIQLAKRFGAEVFATAGSAEKCAFCESLGADHAINYREADFAAEVKRLTDARGRGTVILDMVGAALSGAQREVAGAGGPARHHRLPSGLPGREPQPDADHDPAPDRHRLDPAPPHRAQKAAAIAEGLRREVWPLLESAPSSR